MEINFSLLREVLRGLLVGNNMKRIFYTAILAVVAVMLNAQDLKIGYDPVLQKKHYVKPVVFQDSARFEHPIYMGNYQDSLWVNQSTRLLRYNDLELMYDGLSAGRMMLNSGYFKADWFNGYSLTSDGNLTLDARTGAQGTINIDRKSVV